MCVEQLIQITSEWKSYNFDNYGLSKFKPGQFTFWVSCIGIQSVNRRSWTTNIQQLNSRSIYGKSYVALFSFSLFWASVLPFCLLRLLNSLKHCQGIDPVFLRKKKYKLMTVGILVFLDPWHSDTFVVNNWRNSAHAKSLGCRSVNNPEHCHGTYISSFLEKIAYDGGYSCFPWPLTYLSSIIGATLHTRNLLSVEVSQTQDIMLWKFSA